MKLAYMLTHMPEEIKRQITNKIFLPGESVVRKGERADHVYLLTQGSTSYSYRETKRLSVLGEKAALRMDPATDYDLRRMWIAPEGETETEVLLPLRNQFAAMMDHMAGCVLDGTAPRTPGEEGLRDLLAIEAIHEAARTGTWARVAAI